MKRNNIVIVIVSCLSLLLIAFLVYVFIGISQMKKVPSLSFKDALEYTTKDNKEALITVGIIKDGKTEYRVYGENGKEVEDRLCTYEIGSITKTITALMVKRAEKEGKLNLEDSIDNYLSLPEGDNYPKIIDLITHTSGYKPYYFETPMIKNFFKGRNDFYGINGEMVKERIGKINLDKESYGFSYSNFGFAVLGLVLESVYGESWKTLAEDFLLNELGLENTHVSVGKGELGHTWQWREDDAYLSAGAVTSNIRDMIKYAGYYLEEDELFRECQESVKTINASSSAYRTMGINMDQIGLSWIIDKENGIIWHNGGTGHYNSYIGFSKENNTAVVILSNLAPNYRIPATVLGLKLLMELI